MNKMTDFKKVKGVPIAPVLPFVLPPITGNELEFIG
jgi:hypothetical protein